MSPEPADGLRAQKRRATTSQIETQGLRLFELRGFDETTVDDIAEAAGVSRATVFRYFGSKDDIVYAVEPELLAHMRSLLQDPKVRLGDAVVAYADHVDAHVPDLRDRAAIIAVTPKLVERFAHVRTRWDLAVAHGLAARRGARSGPSFQDHVAASAAMSTLFVSFLTWAVTPNVTLGSLVRSAIETIPDALDQSVTPEGVPAK